jgi:hypothetical protein
MPLCSGRWGAQSKAGGMIVVFVSYEVWCLLGALVLVVAYQILVGKISTAGLLLGKDANAGFSPGRDQLLVLTGTTALYYRLQVLSNHPTTQLPPQPQELIPATGGSNLVFLGGEAYARLFGGNREPGGQ